MTRYVIIGLGIAGFSAAQNLRQQDPASEIIVVSDDPHGYYSRPGLAYYLNGEIPEKQLFPFIKKGRLNLEAQLIIAHVTRLDPASHSMETDTSGTIMYDRLLLALGARSVPLNVPGADLPGVVKLDDLDDTRQILALARHAKTAVVVGGGVLAIEMVEGLVAEGVRVHYLLRGDWYWPGVLTEAEAHLIEHHLKQEGVVLHYCTEIEEILGKKGKVNGIRTTRGEVIPCKLVGVGIGVKASLGLASAAGLATDRGIQVNEYLQTSDPSIYAAGDVAQITDPSTGRSSIDNLWYPGRRQGRLAAMNMAGQSQSYQRKVAINVLRLAGVMTTIIGAIGSGREEGDIYTTRGSSETWRQLLPNTLASESDTEVGHLRLVVSGDNLLGAVLMGNQKISRPLYDLVNNRVDITPIRKQLLASTPQLGQTILDYWMKTKS
jgi:NAD(P)H-nitrite reductase large subunit